LTAIEQMRAAVGEGTNKETLRSRTDAKRAGMRACRDKTERDQTINQKQKEDEARK